MLPPFVIQPSPDGAVSWRTVNLGGAAGARCAATLEAAASVAASTARDATFEVVRMVRVSPQRRWDIVDDKDGSYHKGLDLRRASSVLCRSSSRTLRSSRWRITLTTRSVTFSSGSPSPFNRVAKPTRLANPRSGDLRAAFLRQ